MYMLHRAPELFPGASFTVAHCNFCLRGEESDGDEAFVRSECESLGIPCLSKRFDTLTYASANGVSVEMAARELRYSWFRELCLNLGFTAIATAHNANDNAETLILNLLRGTGTKGMRGIQNDVAISVSTAQEEARKTGFEKSSTGRFSESIPPTALSLVGPSHSRGHGRPRFCEPLPDSVPTDIANIKLLRPLLSTTREEIRKWMEDNGHRWREDRTNAENEAKRNKIRNLVFPVFAEINPSFIKTLGEDMARIRQTDDIADDYFAEAAEKIVKANDNSLEISVVPLLELKHWRYVLWRTLEDCSFSAETFEKLCGLLERYRTQPLGTVTLSGKTFQSPAYILKARRKVLVLSKKL